MAPKRKATAEAEHSEGKRQATPLTLDSGPGRTESRLSSFWREGKFCDVVVRAGGKEFNVHRLVLAAGSEYFSALSEAGRFADSAGSIIELPDISAQTFQTVLTFFYDGKCACSNDDLLEVGEAASFLQAGALLDQACTSILNNLTAASCVGALSFAERHSLMALSKACEAAAAKHFKDLPEASLCALPLPSFSALLSADGLNVETEEQVYDAVLLYARHNHTSPDTDLAKLFGKVRFPLLSKSAFTEKVKTEPMLKGPACLRMLLEAFTAYAYGEPPKERTGGTPKTALDAKGRGMSAAEAVKMGVSLVGRV
jgi:hypothetical protein